MPVWQTLNTAVSGMQAASCRQSLCEWNAGCIMQTIIVPAAFNLSSRVAVICNQMTRHSDALTTTTQDRSLNARRCQAGIIPTAGVYSQPMFNIATLLHQPMYRERCTPAGFNFSCF